MKKNYLDFVPVVNTDWNVIEEDIVEIYVINKGFFNTLAQIFFKRPKISKIRLDKQGSTVWKSIDGNKNIGEIADDIRTDFSEKDEIFYGRLIKFINILKENKFIAYKK